MPQQQLWHSFTVQHNTPCQSDTTHCVGHVCVCGQVVAICLWCLRHTCRHSEACLINFHVTLPCSHGETCSLSSQRETTEEDTADAFWSKLVAALRPNSCIETTALNCPQHTENMYSIRVNAQYLLTPPSEQRRVNRLWFLFSYWIKTLFCLTELKVHRPQRQRQCVFMCARVF